ncbi:hypothetical protein ELBR111191_14785 [Elizabethkingia bruuniana]|uniref:hypothetical protein n=1 Tax=Elizabethkingia bruuniana TaxID=1756149 RepID=UPI0009994563|nr:hypothetical protein [Elizabethkingia bruuniana]AQX83996.1 hypothetical protein AYC65_02720 [Elizabethkingia bruuniana]OPB64415.1 hypothetical protein BAY12_06360 [Elizabethkingia bruuniana]
MNKKETELQNSSIKDLDKRLNQVMDYLLTKNPKAYKNQTLVAKEVGLSRPNLNAALKGEKYLTKYTVDKFCLAFPELNEIWLLEGKGEMLNSKNTQSEIIYDNNDSISQPNDTIEGILDVVTLLFAQVNTQDKSLLFIQDQILKLVKKQDEMNKDMKELMKSLNKTTVKN